MTIPGPIHGGAIDRLRAEAGPEVLDASANLNPLGPPEWLRGLISAEVSDLIHYPDPQCTRLVTAMAACWQVDPNHLVVGNGSSELLAWLPLVLPRLPVLLPVPCYGEYGRAFALADRPVETIPLIETDRFAVPWEALAARLAQAPHVVVLGHPNNPTGRCLDTDRLRRLAQDHPHSRFLIDEAFAEFVDGFPSLLTGRPGNVLVLRSATKAAAIPGLRLGAVVAEPDLAEALRRRLPPWSVNRLAQAVGQAFYEDTDYLKRTIEFTTTQRTWLADRLTGLGLSVQPGAANFLLVRLPAMAPSGPQVAAATLRQGVAVRTCTSFAGLGEGWLRLAVGGPDGNRRLVEALAQALHRPQPIAVPARRVHTLMLQGTASSVGKSLLTAAFCRILLQDGYRVAPFKAQNMSNNSGVDRQGGEMGRAQVLQAQACRIEPDTRMNPVLLKPSSDTGCQVVLRGRAVGHRDVLGYQEFKRTALATALAAYDELANDFDVIVLEGAGSPGEINLKRHDIVNMGFVRHRPGPVLLVGDIDRGGVYASFIGHLEVMDEWERRQVRGLLVNRFRGDARLLDDAHRQVLTRTGKPVLGVVPWLRELGLPEEDATALDQPGRPHACRELDLAAIGLGRISNFTDLDPLAAEPDVALRWVRRPEDLGRPDAILIPGSKSTIADLAALRASGLAAAILAQAATGTPVIGICGGYQMLGQRIEDPQRVESPAGAVDGLGLLPITTVFSPGKILGRVEALHLPSGLPVQGYEIHHGVSPIPSTPCFRRADGEGLGLAVGRHWGTYIHGVFDADGFRRWFLDGLRTAKGLPALPGPGAAYNLEAGLDRLAEAVRRSVDLPAIWRIMGLA